MKSKFIAVLALVAASAMAHAAPTYEVTIGDEAPVRVTLDNAGVGAVGSQEQAFNVPATGVTLYATGPERSNLGVTVHRNEPVMRRFTPADGTEGNIELPGVRTTTQAAAEKLLPAQQMKVFGKSSEACPPGGQVIITRID